MSVELTAQAEARRVLEAQARRESKWELLKTFSIVEAVRYAKEHGWETKQVQVRQEDTSVGSVYYVEPYEQGCGCRGLLRYADFYGPYPNSDEG